MLPHEKAAEEHVLGALLSANADLAAEVMPMLAPEDFYDPGHEKIFAAMQVVAGQKMRIDFVTVAERMRSMGTMSWLSARGNESYLSELAVQLPYVGGAVDHARLIRRAAVRRKLIALADELKQQALTGEKTETEIIGAHQTQIGQLAEASLTHTAHRIGPLLTAGRQRYLYRQDHQEAVVGVPTGLDDLDERTQGFQAGDLIIEAARPSMGKTSLALKHMLHASRAGFPVLFFSAEMSKEAIVDRIFALDGRIENSALRTGYMDGRDWKRIGDTLLRFVDKPLWIDDRGSPPLSYIEARARKWRREFPAGQTKGMIVVDYLQLVLAEESGRRGRYMASREEQVATISRGMKGLAKELNVPVVALAQLSRECEKRNDKRPMCSDLRESGSLEQDADLILFIYRDEQYNKQSPDAGIAEIIIGKQRNGDTGTVRAAFVRQYACFENLAHRPHP